MQDDYETIIYIEQDGIHRLIFNRPDQLNAINETMKWEIQSALIRVQNSAPRVLLISGNGRGFCAGQDLGDRDVNAGPLDLGEGPDKFYNPLIRTLTSLPAPVVCAVNGVAAGAGVNIAIACDVVVAKSSAKFVQAFSSIGLVPDAGGSWHLTRKMGVARALSFTLLSERLSANEAVDAGLISKVIDGDVFDAEVERIVTALSRAPTFGLASAKRALRDAMYSSLDEALDFERDSQRQCGHTNDYAEGVNAFKEKRLPEFKGN